jgi:hypothetical protein
MIGMSVDIQPDLMEGENNVPGNSLFLELQATVTGEAIELVWLVRYK